MVIRLMMMMMMKYSPLFRSWWNGAGCDVEMVVGDERQMLEWWLVSGIER